jgi:hypothetical protein
MLIFCEIVCWIDGTRGDYIKIPVCQVKEQVLNYTAIQKLLQTDKTGVIRSCSNIAKTRPSLFGQLWQLMTFDTGAPRGSTLTSKKGLDLLYEWLKPRTYRSKIWLFFSPLKLAKNSKTRDFFLLKFPKSSSEMNFKRELFRGFLTVSLEMNLEYQSNIYLWTTITEFFSNRPVLL